MKVETCGASDAGLVRSENEDRWRADGERCLAVLADGMGGASCGEIAAEVAVETVFDALRLPPVCLPPPEQLKSAVEEANRAVRERARWQTECNGMGSTIVAAYWDLPALCIANVGDSRAYLSRDGSLRQLSHDHTLLSDLRARLRMSEAEAAAFPHKHVLTQAVGTAAKVAIHLQEETLRPGDVVLLCSDGLTGPVPDPEIAAILAAGGPLAELAARLIERGKAAGASDNVTVVLLRCTD